MYKKLKICISGVLAAVMFLTFVGCDSDKNSNSELNIKQEETAVSDVRSDSSAASENITDTDIMGNSPIELVLKNSDADGYTICKIYDG